jgi:hypothetical protein
VKAKKQFYKESDAWQLIKEKDANMLFFSEETIESMRNKITQGVITQKGESVTLTIYPIGMYRYMKRYRNHRKHK